MKPIGNWDQVQAAAERQKLPAGGYVVKIMDACVRSYEGRDGNAFEKLELSIDIAEGAYKDFYAGDYRSQRQEDRRWKGVLRLYIPRDDGSERDEWTKSQLKAATGAVEDSNAGYRWDWDERGLKGKIVGCLFREEEWAFGGRTGWATRPFRLLPAEDVRAGKTTTPHKKPLKRSQSAVERIDELPETVSMDDLPF